MDHITTLNTIIATVNNSAPPHIYVPGPILSFFIARWLWRKTSVTLPTGERITRQQQATIRHWQNHANRVAHQAWKAEQKRIRTTKEHTS